MKALLPLTRGVKPLVTSTGVQIGVDYIPPRIDRTTYEEHFWQGILLGIHPEWTQRSIIRAAACVFVLAIILTTFWKAKEVLA